MLGARAAYLPDLALNYSYGIDAAQFATKGPGGVNNLGYSATATLDIPIWDWLATRASGEAEPRFAAMRCAWL